MSPSAYPEHRFTSNNRRHRPIAEMDDQSIFSNPQLYLDGSRSPRELLAMGAVLDHLCQGGTVSDSTQVFFKEANRGMRRSKSYDMSYSIMHSQQKERPAPDETDTIKSPFSFVQAPSFETFSCLSACQSPAHEETVKIVATVDETAPHVLLNEAKYDEDGETAYYTIEDTLTYDDRTYDSRTYAGDDRTWRQFDEQTFDERTWRPAGDETVVMQEDGTVLDVTSNSSTAVSSKKSVNAPTVPPVSPKKAPLDLDPAVLEQYISEKQVDEDILGEIADNFALINRSLFAAENPMSFDEWDVLSWDNHTAGDDDESVNSLAKKMHTMLQRKSSKLFSTSEYTKGNGQRAVVPKKKNQKKINSPPRKQQQVRAPLSPKRAMAASEAKQASPQSPFRTIGTSVLANASSKAWAASFPAKPVTAPILLKQPLHEDPSVRFASSSDNVTHTTEASTASLTAISDHMSHAAASNAASMPTVKQRNGKGVIRRTFSGSKSALPPSPQRSGSLPPRVPSTVPMSPSSPPRGPSPRRFPSSPARSLSGSTISSMSSHTDAMSVSASSTTSSVSKRRRFFGRRPRKQPSTLTTQLEGVLEADDASGFEVQQVDHARLEI